MSKLPSWNDSAENVKQTARSLIPWLETPFECPECGVLCRAEHVYDPRTAAFNNGACPAWVCPDCGSEYYREEAWHS